MSQLNSEDRAQLREFLADRFSLDEMKTLCFDLGLDYEEFPHATKTEFSRELIVYFERHNKMGCLVAEMLEVRPDGWLTQLLAQVSSCQPNLKVQVVLSNDKIKSRPDLKLKLAELLGISAEEVMIIATAAGSVKVLLGVPPKAAGRLNGLALPYQLDGYEIISVTPYAALPPSAQTKWQTAVAQTAMTQMAVMQTAATHATVPTTTAPVTAVATTGLSLGLKIIISILIIIGIIVVGVVVWGNRQPELTITNQCTTALAIPAPDPIKALLSLPDAIPAGGTLSLPILTGEGVYELLLTRGGVMVLRLPRPLPGLGLQDVELGAVGADTAVTLNGRPLNPPQQFPIESSQSYDLVICAPR